MRRILALFIAASVMVTAFAAAASITLTVPKIGSASASVTSCDSAVSSSWNSAYEAAIGEYEVTTVTVSDLDGAACNGATLKVSLSKADNTQLGSEVTATVASTDTSKSLDFSGQNLKASEVGKVHVALVGP